MNQQKKNILQNMNITAILQFTLNTALILFAISISVLLGKEIVYFFQMSIFNKNNSDHYNLLENILIFFLYFEFIAMIGKYFKEHYHFPIRYFLYIGITAMIRLIIVSHENPVQTLLYSCSILVLIISFFIMNSSTARKGRL